VLTFTRELTQHINQLNYFNLQYDQSTYYHQLGQTEDHRLVETFYQLNARKTEISSTKTIWKATHYEQLLRCELTLFKKWMSLPVVSMTNGYFHGIRLG
ncbi:unnamed protein product, partial [Rotaria socialis]